VEGSARRITVVTNPTSGKGRASRARLLAVPRLRDAGFVVDDRVSADPGDARRLARAAVAEGAEAVVACGGDGMVHLVVQELAGSETALGLLPGGTGDDVARYFDVPRRDPLAAADRIIGSRRRRIDLARSGDRWFVTVLAAGFDALVNERANAMTWPRGQMRYNLATISELRAFQPLDYTLELDGVSRRLAAMMVAVGNGPSFGGGLRITEGAVLDDGLLDVVVIKPISKPELVWTYPKLYKGTHTGHPAYERHRVRELTVATTGVVSYADGERFAPLPLTVECVPGALAVLA
jgi:diacylglycerol kinase (ATP)